MRSCCRTIPGRFEPSQVTSPLREQSPSDCGLENFEFQTSQNQPSPIIAIEMQLETTRPINTVMPLDRISSVMSPLTERNVLRSSRLNKHDGFCAVRLDKEPTKKCKISVVKIDGRTIEARPVRLAVLQWWGIDCGIAPSDLSNDALLQTPPQATPNEMQMMTTMQFECSYGGPFWNWNILSIMNVSATFLFWFLYLARCTFPTYFC